MGAKQTWANRTRAAVAGVRRVIKETRRYRKETASYNTQTHTNPALQPARFTPEPPPQVFDEESLDVWGFKDTKFFINSNGNIELSGHRYALSGSELPKLLPWIEKTLGLSLEKGDARTSRYPTFIPDPVSNSGFIKELKVFLKEDALTDDGKTRLRHGHGHTQEEMYAVKYGEVKRIPDLVIYPESEDDVVRIVQAAVAHDVCLIPYGGGTNVTEALRCPENEKRMIVSVDMKRMNRILWIDPVNRMACIQAGMVGRHIMTELARHGYTMGHEPDSVEFSTLGGWIATHASGMKKNKYGNIENLVVDVNAVGASGLVQRYATGPREAIGIDPRLWLLGSEGSLGIITQAVVKLFPLPEVKHYGSVLFPTFADGVQFMYELSQLPTWPASARLVDNMQFQLSMALKPADPDETDWDKRKSKLQKLYVTQIKQFDPDQMVACTLVFEGTAEEVAEQERAVYGIASRHHGLKGGGENGERGYQLTFGIAYIRDFMMNHYLMAESFETSMAWTDVHAVCENVKKRVAAEHAKRGIPGKPFVTCRVTQVYKTGAVVYFYCAFYAKGVENPDKVFNEIEHAAREEILQSGGSLSHHHGIGKLRRDFLPDIYSPAALTWKNQFKQAIDPMNIFGSQNQLVETEFAAPVARKIGLFARLILWFKGLFNSGENARKPETITHNVPIHTPVARTETHAAPEKPVRKLEILTAPESKVTPKTTSASQASLLLPKGAARIQASDENFFSGKAFIVTGASSGIGRELTIALAKAGASVLAMARSEDRLKELQGITGQVMLKGDVQSGADCRFAVESAINAFGRLDGIIHNAGISMRALAEETDLKVVDSMLATNFYPLVHLYQSGIEHLRNTGGHFIGISSMMGHFSTHLRSAYCASKHAAQGYLDSIRLENAEHGVHVMSAAPGFVRTEITVRALNGKGKQNDQESHNTKGGLEADFVAAKILKGIEMRKRDVYPSRMKEKLGLAMSRVAPRLLDKVLSSTSVT